MAKSKSILSAIAAIGTAAAAAAVIYSHREQLRELAEDVRERFAPIIPEDNADEDCDDIEVDIVIDLTEDASDASEENGADEF